MVSEFSHFPSFEESVTLHVSESPDLKKTVAKEEPFCQYWKKSIMGQIPLKPREEGLRTSSDASRGLPFAVLRPSTPGRSYASFYHDTERPESVIVFVFQMADQKVGSRNFLKSLERFDGTDGRLSPVIPEYARKPPQKGRELHGYCRMQFAVSDGMLYPFHRGSAIVGASAWPVRGARFCAGVQKV
jgi:hypothetical protein